MQTASFSGRIARAAPRRRRRRFRFQIPIRPPWRRMPGRRPSKPPARFSAAYSPRSPPTGGGGRSSITSRGSFGTARAAR